MSKIVWDEDGSRLYEAGVSKGVLYVWDDTNNSFGNGVAWNGLVSVSESPEGGEPNPYYADNIKYFNLMSVEDFNGSIEAYHYPVEFEACDGTADYATGMKIGQQDRKKFCLCYRTEIGSDEKALGKQGYKIHIVYNALATPSERSYETVDDSPEPMTFSWDFSTTPVVLDDETFKATAYVVLDSRTVPSAKLTTILNSLYGTNAGEGGTPAATDPTLLMPDQIAGIITAQ